MHRVEIVVWNVVMSVNHLKLIIIQFSVDYLNIVYHSKFPQYLGRNNVSNYLCFLVNLKFKLFSRSLTINNTISFQCFYRHIIYIILHKMRIN